MLTLLVLLALTLATAAACGGSLAQLSTMQVRGLFVAWLAVVARLTPMLLKLSSPIASRVSWGVAFFAVVVIGALNVRTVKGVALLSLGALSNLAVIVANGGMPVVPWAIVGDKDPLHLALAAPHLAVLTDVLVLRIGSVFSVGDVLMFVGFMTAVLSGACLPKAATSARQ